MERDFSGECMRLVAVGSLNVGVDAALSDVCVRSQDKSQMKVDSSISPTIAVARQ